MSQTRDFLAFLDSLSCDSFSHGYDVYNVYDVSNVAPPPPTERHHNHCSHCSAGLLLAVHKIDALYVQVIPQYVPCGAKYILNALVTFVDYLTTNDAFA